eukprot:1298236-Pyramimonas_sp.AAC.1
MPQELAADTGANFQRTSRSYPVILNAPEAASRFTRWAFTSPLSWSDYRDRATTFVVQVRSDISRPARMRETTLSCLWGPMKVELKNKGFWNVSLRMGCS